MRILCGKFSRFGQRKCRQEPHLFRQSDFATHHTDVRLRLGIIVTRRKPFARQGDILAIFSYFCLTVDKHYVSSLGQIVSNLERQMCDFFSRHNGWFAEKMPVPGSDAFIRFKRKPNAKLNVLKTVSIPDWGVSVPIENATRESVRNAVVRKYVMLADKSRKHMLTDEERSVWKQLLADSDYGDFCQRTAPAIKDVATRIRAVKDGVEVIWSSGESETISGDLAKSLAIVEDGEEFSARVKFIDYKLVALTEVVPLGKPTTVRRIDLALQ